MANANTTMLNDPMNPQATVAPAGIIAGAQQTDKPAAGGGIIQQNMLPTNVNATMPVTNPAGAPAENSAATPDYLAQSKGLYNQYLGRDGDQEGVNYWANELKNGKSLDEVTNAFKFSANKVYSDFANHADPTGENLSYLYSNYNPEGIDLVTKDLKSGAAASYLKDGKVTLPASNPAVTTPPTGFNVSPNPVAQGIIGTQVAGFTPTQLSNPTQWKVDGDQTVQGQMTRMIDPNNPYYQAWKTAGAQDAAARGFTGNSSIRDTAIMDSIMRNATPIATSDASTYAKAAGYNADTENNFAIKNQEASNTAGQFNSGQANAMAQAKLSADTSKYSTDKSSATQLATAKISADTQKFVSTLSSDTQVKVANLNNASQAAISAAHDANAVLLSNNSDAQNAFRDYVNAVSIIQNNDKMSGDAKTDAMNVSQDLYNKRISAIKTASPNTPASLDNNTYGYLDKTKEATKVSNAQAAKRAAEEVGGTDVSGLVDFSV